MNAIACLSKVFSFWSNSRMSSPDQEVQWDAVARQVVAVAHEQQIFGRLLICIESQPDSRSSDVPRRVFLDWKMSFDA